MMGSYQQQRDRGKTMDSTTTPLSFVTSTLSRFAPFNALGEPALDILAQGVRVRRLVAGEMLVCRGDRPASMFLVARGEIKLMLCSSAGSERIVRLAGTGATFCEESVFNDSPLALSAQAGRDSMVLQIPERLLQLAMAADAGFACGLMQRMSERITQLVADMEQCEQRNGTQRVAHYLVKNANRASDAIEVKLSTTKQTIASQLNMTPESLSRVLNRFKREGYIIPRGHRSIRLTDFDGLQSLAA